MNPEPDFKSPESLEMVGDPLRLPTALLSDDPRYRIRPMQQVISALVGGLITTFVGK